MVDFVFVQSLEGTCFSLMYLWRAILKTLQLIKIEQM